MVPPQHLIQPGDTVRFLRSGRWRFAIVTKVGTKWLHVSLEGHTTRVRPADAQLWKPTNV